MPGRDWQEKGVWGWQGRSSSTVRRDPDYGTYIWGCTHVLLSVGEVESGSKHTREFTGASPDAWQLWGVGFQTSSNIFDLSFSSISHQPPWIHTYPWNSHFRRGYYPREVSAGSYIVFILSQLLQNAWLDLVSWFHDLLLGPDLQFEQSCSKWSLSFLLPLLLYIKFTTEHRFLYYLHIFHLKIKKRQHWEDTKQQTQVDFLEGSLAKSGKPGIFKDVCVFWPSDVPCKECAGGVKWCGAVCTRCALRFCLE